MKSNFDPYNNYIQTKKTAGYVSRRRAVQADYDRVGFKSGLEVHQQLKTQKKLFCNCPAGLYNKKSEYDAELIRHMRPTLSELGEYDGTALMEFKTRKEIIYRIKNETACTYDIDDTPPFPLNREALEIALEIAMLCRLNIVGEVHIIRKQYLDGSIPTGFQRTAILGVEGEIRMPRKKVRLIQLSLEEDSCREISDSGHVRIYQTDRLGMPLIETVTYPDFINPDEVREGAETIRFLNRSTGKVRTGIGTGREDVNVSCRGGSRVEIKGVAHNRWIPDLTHNEVFRQWALLLIRSKLAERIPQPGKWSFTFKELKLEDVDDPVLRQIRINAGRLAAVNLPRFAGLLSHFTQPGKMFADEISDRLKVIACIEKPNMLHSEQREEKLKDSSWERIREQLSAREGDAQILLWGPKEDIPTALETVEERCRLAMEGVPRESRKSFADGTTVFERVLPGPDRMYPDTDSSPVPLDEDYIKKIRRRIPMDVHERIRQMKRWEVPEDCFHFLLGRNLVPLMEKIISHTGADPSWLGTLLGQRLKSIEGRISNPSVMDYEKIYELLVFLKKKRIRLDLAEAVLPEIYAHPEKDFIRILKDIGYKRRSLEEITIRIPGLLKEFSPSPRARPRARRHWVMGKIRPLALGNVALSQLSRRVDHEIQACQTQSQ
ncbi:MAG: Glu-tRNA(Gln) amidotransferase subunit GatE [Candidatus Aminicenantes bacterium]